METQNKTETENVTTMGFKPTWNNPEIEQRTIRFVLSEDGRLCWAGYNVDTLMENAEDYLQGNQLCTDGGSNTCITNMREWVRFVLKNRWDIETELKELNK